MFKQYNQISFSDKTQMESFQLGIKDRRHEALGELRVLPDELISVILEDLSARDICRLACVSSVMYIFCNEEPLWMTLCLKSVRGQLEYKSSWKSTTLYQQNISDELVEACRKSLHFDGFNSLFLYKRFYRCFTTLNAFSVDRTSVEKKISLSLDDFYHEYDGRKPVLLTELAETWPARNTWTTEQLLHNYGDTKFKLSQRSSGKITMKFKDYVSYINQQHDEDPLYIFDDKFGEVAPNLLKDYSVPNLFQEDFFDVLDMDQRPPFRWLIIGPERSGASWHVDPALTSAWNTLLCGRKRWALYPPGRVPLGVTVHVNEEDGDVSIDTPTSLQWWLDIYPMLADQDKPIEFTQLPGETIYVPSGWWHCVLNLETTIAVTQNFVNSQNFKFVCLDMAPGHRHKGVCRAGLLAIDAECFEYANVDATSANDQPSYPDLNRKQKRLRVSKYGEDAHADGIDQNATNGSLESNNMMQIQEFSYDIDFLSKFLESERDHYISVWSPSNCIGQREMRQWLHRLWVGKPGMRELIWKGACLAINAEKWSECMEEICSFHNLPSPLDDEKLPVGTGSNPVYLTANHVIKIYVEGGVEASIHCLGTELEFYSLLHKLNSPLQNHIPDVLASGILFQDNESYGIVLWDGKGVPEVIAKCNMIEEVSLTDGFPFGIWSKKLFELKKAGMPATESSVRSATIWPYIITKRCKGDIFAHLRDTLAWNDVLNLASFLGDQLRYLHLLPIPSYDDIAGIKQKLDNELSSKNVCLEEVNEKCIVPVEWQLFIETLTRRKKDVSSRLAKWGDPIPSSLIEKVEEYLPDDFSALLNGFKDERGMYSVCKSSSWIHSDIMDDNIYMEKYSLGPCSVEQARDISPVGNGSVNGFNSSEGKPTWSPSYILDFSDISIGDSLCDLIPIHLDIFRGDPNLLKQLLKSYKLPFLRKASQHEPVQTGNKFERLSYHAMCYCILHDDNVLGAIFSLYKGLKMASSWEEVEETVWGELNTYEGFS